MEKAECGQFSILSFLLQESQTTVKAVMEETGFSKATLTKYVTLLNDKALDSGLELAIHSEDENLRLSIGAATKGRDIRSLFLESAVKYQILVYLLYHQQFLAHQLAQELVISEATLGRHLAGLNQILSEFDLSIQNGRWRGPEHQIRYFYFCLFRKVWSSQEWEGHMQKPERKQEIANLEEICGASLSVGQKLDLVLWAHISQQRLRVNACQFQVIEEKMRGYFDNIFYLRLLRKVPSFFAGQHIPLGVEDGEMMIFFSFLLSHRILPPLPTFQQGTDLDKKILWEWLQLIEYMAENGGQHMRIGLDLTSGFLVFSRMAAILKRYLEYNRFITIEAYDPSRHYDLLVTNNPIHKKEQTPVYYLKNDLDMEDLAGIRQLLFT